MRNQTPPIITQATGKALRLLDMSTAASYAAAVDDDLSHELLAKIAKVAIEPRF